MKEGKNEVKRHEGEVMNGKIEENRKRKDKQGEGRRVQRGRQDERGG